MVRTQIYLTEEEKTGLTILAESTGKKQAELIREAVDRFIDSTSIQQRDVVLGQAAGMWKDRNDLPDFDAARSSWDRG
jgi:predicted transcriptional regulator